MMGPITINTEQQHCAVWWLVTTARVQTMRVCEAMTVTTVTTPHRTRAARQPGHGARQTRVCHMSPQHLNNPLIYTWGSSCTCAVADDNP